MKVNRYTYHFDNNIEVDTVQELIDILSQHEKIDLYFSTEGGEVSSANILISYLNSRKNDIVVYITEALISAGVLLLTDFKGKIVLTEDLDFILAHKIDRLVYTNRKQLVETKVLLAQLVEVNKKIADKLLKIGFTPKEIKEYNSGKDVILYRKDFNRLKITKQNQ